MEYWSSGTATSAKQPYVARQASPSTRRTSLMTCFLLSKLAAARRPTLQPSHTPALQASSASGFTLIEVVVAFTVAALIIAAVASGLVAALRAEATAQRQQTAGEALRTLQTGLWLGIDTNSLATNLPAGWRLASETTEHGEGSNRVVWSQWRLEAHTRPSCSAGLASQQP